MTSREDKIRGAIYGFAIGDAMGAVAEFETRESIKRKYGKITEILGGGWLKLKPGEVTDDTQMTLCIFDAMLEFVVAQDLVGRANEDFNYSYTEPPALLDLIKEKFVEWKKSGPKDIGNLCMRGISLIEQGLSPEYDAEALGNGSLMRALPFALINREDLNIEQGLMTHNNSTCSEKIIEYTRMIQMLLNGITPSSLNIGLQDPSGHVSNTFNNSVYWALKSGSFRDAVEGAVNDGGDADTIAAITGSIAGARFGYSAIPAEWIETLSSDIKSDLDEYAEFVICREFDDYL